MRGLKGLNQLEIDLIYREEQAQLENIEPCDLYDRCEDCPNWNTPDGCQKEERKAA